MPDINTKVKLTGEAEYKQAMSNINASMKALNSEMKLTTAQFAENGKSVDALKAKNEILVKSIGSQEQKLAAMKEQLKKVSDAYGENHTKTLQMKASVTDAETELVKMKNSLKANQEAIEQASDKSKSFGDALQGVADKLGIKLPNSARSTLSALNNVNTRTAVITAGFTALAKAVVDIEKKLFNMSKEAASAADSLATLSLQTGVSTDSLQKFQYASDLIDVSLETLQSSLTKLTANMAKTQEGNEGLQKAFNDLGVKVSNADGSLRDANDVFLEAVDALGEIQNQTERDAAAMEIFGKSAQELNPLIDAGSERLRELGKEAEQTGYVLSTDALQALTDMDDAMQRLNKTQEGLRNQLASQFAPYATEAIEKVTKVFQQLGEAVKDSGVVEAFGMILSDTLAIISPIDQLTTGELPALQKALNGVAQLCAAISDTMSFIISGMKSLYHIGTGQFGKAWQDWSNQVEHVGITGSSNLQKVMALQQPTPGSDVLIGEAALDKWYADQAAANGLTYDTGATAPTYHYSSYEEYAAQQRIFQQEVQAINKMNRLGVGLNAGGTQNWRGGWSWVGESGPELAYLPQGSQVINATEARGVGGDTYNITIDAKNVREFNDIVKLVNEARWRARKRSASGH